MQKVINKVISTNLLSLPLFYAIYLVYIRLIVSRAPRDITIITSNLKLFLILCIILGFISRIYVQLKVLEIIPQKEAKNKYIIRVKNWIEILNFHLNAIKINFLRILGHKIDSYNDFALWMIQKTYVYIESKIFKFLLFIFEIGIKLLIVTVFLLEVFYFKQINYFYKMLGLLLIPIITNILIDIMSLFHKDNLVPLISLLDSKPIEDTEYDEFCFFDETLEPNFARDIEDFIENHLEPVFDYAYTLQYIHTIRRKYKFKPILLMISLAYLITWVYVLFVGVGII